VLLRHRDLSLVDAVGREHPGRPCFTLYWFQEVLEIWERELLSVELQFLRQVHADFFYGSSIVGLFFNCLLYLMWLDSDIIGFWCFGI
jgi:hypothetical protein